MGARVEANPVYCRLKQNQTLTTIDTPKCLQVQEPSIHTEACNIRQLQILQAISLGYSENEIAYCLGLSAVSIKNYKSSLIKDARTEKDIDAKAYKASLIIAGVKNGLFSVPEIPDIINLNQREEEVLTQMMDGKELKDIAANLFLAFGTIKKRAEHIRSKLNARNNYHVIAIYTAYKMKGKLEDPGIVY